MLDRSDLKDRRDLGVGGDPVVLHPDLARLPDHDRTGVDAAGPGRDDQIPRPDLALLTEERQLAFVLLRELHRAGDRPDLARTVLDRADLQFGA